MEHTDISGIQNKIENEGATSAGILSAADFNVATTAITTEQNNTDILDANKLDVVTEGDLDEIFPLT